MIKLLKLEAVNISRKLTNPITAEDLLRDDGTDVVFPNAPRISNIYVIIPQSEAVVQCDFSKMRQMLNEKDTNFDNAIVDALKCICCIEIINIHKRKSKQ